ncbi:PAS domain-containing protein [Archangium violaceum]|uniref:GAF domain-containing sensor histidine kinase n=1 Tax=Archangium violaceum TaxID=83451 RepID=UPI00194EE0B0|nr:PAS domain-containing protein [Archangium violaceum]QRN99658.1 PAS domain-containing protein [Archangium violaceum]
MVKHDRVEGEQGMGGLGDFIRRHGSHILAHWEVEVRQLPYTRDLSRPRLLDHLPELLERMARVVESAQTGEHPTLEAVPEVHALERLDSGFDLDAVAEEYALLRACVLQLYGDHVASAGAEHMALAMREMLRFNRTFDEAVAAAVSRYAKARERTLVALDRISEAALGTEDLDTFLPRLLRVMLETTEAVDSVSLMLREGELLRVRASVGLEEEVTSGFTSRVGEGFCGKIAAEGRPVELRSAATDPLVRSEAIRVRGTRALYGVPLLYGGEVIGVVHMGSRTAFEFSHEDKLLFRAMVSRTTALVVQTQLAASERAARQEAEEHKQLLRLIIEQSGDAITMVDARGVVRIFNAEARRRQGIDLKEVGPSEWSEAYGLLTLDERPLPLEESFLYRALQGETVSDVRWKVRRPDGAVRTFVGTAAPLRLPDGSLAGAVLTARDETERLLREAQVDALVEAAPAGLALLDTELRYVHINEALATANGLPVEDHLGKRVSEVVPASASMLEPRLRQVLETGEAARGNEFSVAPANDPGVLHHWVADFFPVRGQDGRVLGVGGVILDITERERQEQKLRQTAEFRERFLGIVSHDLRNPLNAILLSANALLHADDLPANRLKTVRRIAASGERMGRMIAELLDFTRGRLGGGIPIHRQPMNLRHQCRHVMEELEISHPGRELRLVAEGHFHGMWDPDRLAQLLGNLGKNALDYSPPDTRVDFRLHDEGDSVRVEVHNEGSPIPCELLSGIFEPFRRAVEGDGHPTSGLGLGLFIVQRIAEAHGGTVEVRSHVGDGTTFIVRLPRYAGGSEAPGEAVSGSAPG